MTDYKDIVFTKHAKERSIDRSISPESVYQTIHFPDQTFKTKGGNGQKFSKTMKDRRYQVVANYLVKEKKWLVISVWVRGEDDKLPVVWQLISLPFKLIWWLLNKLWQLIAKIAGKK